MNMSFFHTADQVRAGTKGVTRRIGWLHAKPSQVRWAIEKGQGIPKGGKQTRIRQIRFEDVRRERLDRMTTDRAYGLEEIRLEGGLWDSPEAFVNFFCAANRCQPWNVITRIAFSYVDEEAARQEGQQEKVTAGLRGAPQRDDTLPLSEPRAGRLPSTTERTAKPEIVSASLGSDPRDAVDVRALAKDLEFAIDVTEPRDVLLARFEACIEAAIQTPLKRLHEEIASLRQAVQHQRCDDLCWVIDLAAAKALPEAEFLESCRRFRNQIAAERGEETGLKTIAQLEAELASLTMERDDGAGYRLEKAARETAEHRLAELLDQLKTPGIVWTWILRGDIPMPAAVDALQARVQALEVIQGVTGIDLGTRENLVTACNAALAIVGASHLLTYGHDGTIGTAKIQPSPRIPSVKG